MDQPTSSGQPLPSPEPGATPGVPHAPQETVSFHGSIGAAATTDGRPVKAMSTALPRIDGYEILEVLGRGGMGVVYKARQNGLNRLVALKMILAGAHAGADDIARFRSEAQAVARLQHPHIVQIHEVGAAGEYPFFSLEFVDGGSLAGVLNGTPQPPGVAAQVIRVLAEAMQFAHENGVVHRDLKPANILLARGRAAEGDTVTGRHGDKVRRTNVSPRHPVTLSPCHLPLGTPKIADFGLAKRLDDASGQTASGSILGTPSYMAPEQASGRVRDIGPAADVYSLGAILYEMLSGRSPFRAATIVETLDQVRTHEPVPPRQLEPSVPADLETICLKCLQKDPKKRYASAAALAEDLGRFEADEPITARPVGRLERGWRWCRRNPMVAGLLAVVAASLLLGTAVASVLAVRANKSAAQATQLAKNMVQLAGREKDQRMRADLQTAQLLKEHGHRLCEQGENTQGLLWLVRSLERVAQTQEAVLEAELLGHANDLEHLIRMDLALFERDAHQLRAVLAHKGSVMTVAFSPDGKVAATGGLGFGARLWDVATGEPLGQPLPHAGEVRSVQFSADGKTLLTTGHDLRPSGLDLAPPGQGKARLWDLATRQPLGPAIESPSAILCAALHPDGRTVLVGRADGKAQLWDAVAGQLLGAVAHDGSPSVHAVAFSRNGTHFATGCGNNGGVRRWTTATRQPASPVFRSGNINALAFQADGNAILMGGTSEMAYLWDPVSGEELRPPLRHRGQIRASAISPDGRLALVTDDDQTARLWDLGTGLLRGGPIRLTGRGYAAAFSPDGQFFLTGDEGGAARLWRLAPGMNLGQALPSRSEIWAAAYRHDGTTILAGDRAGFISLWDAATGALRRPVANQGRSFRAVAWSPDGSRYLSGEGDTPDSVVRQWDPSTGREAGPMLASGPVKDLAWSPDGKTILTGAWSAYGQMSGVRLGAQRWDAATGKPIEPFLKHSADIWAVAYSPDGKTILTAGGDRTARLWDAATGAPLGEPLLHPAEVWSAVFRPDGKLVLTGGRDGQARVWDIASGRVVGKTMPHPTEIRSLAFSPDGTAILTGSRDRFARLWDFQTRQPIGPLLPQFAIIERVHFGPVGRTFLTSGRDNTVRQWILPLPMPGDAPQVRDWVETITGLVLDPNDAIQVLPAEDWRKCRARVLESGAFKEHAPAVPTAPPSSDGKKPASGSEDKTAKPATGKKHPSEEAGIKSTSAQVRADLTILNRSGQTIKVFWIDYRGDRKFIQAVKDRGAFTHKTYLTHPSLITDEYDNAWYIYLPTAQPSTVEVLEPEKK